MDNTTDLPEGVLPISIIIPTYSEEESLPVLLKNILEQTFQPQEVIVADAFSPDRTREIAQSFGAKVVDGGKPSVGRNRGAAAAKGEWLLFIDADSLLATPLTLVNSYVECVKNSIDVASPQLAPIPNEFTVFARVMGGFTWFLRNTAGRIQNVTQKVLIEAGAFILVKREIFDKVGGFREDVPISDDVLFYQDAVKAGANYRCLTETVQTSSRRFSTPKKAWLATKYVLAQVGALALGVYFGTKVIKKISKSYGRMGGGDGIVPE